MNGPQIKVFVGQNPVELQKRINDFLKKLFEDLKKKDEGFVIIKRTLGIFSRQTMSGESVEMHVSLFYDFIGHGFNLDYEQIKIFHHLHDPRAESITQEFNEFIAQQQIITDLLFASCLDFGECSPCIAVFYKEHEKF